MYLERSLLVLGGKILKTIELSGSRDTSFVPQVTELRNLKAEVVYAPILLLKNGNFI